MTDLSPHFYMTSAQSRQGVGKPGSRT